MRDDDLAAARKLLGVSEDVDHASLDAAFHELCLLYSEDNLATYSLLSSDEREEQLDRLRVAHELIRKALGDKLPVPPSPSPAEPAEPNPPPGESESSEGTADGDGGRWPRFEPAISQAGQRQRESLRTPASQRASRPEADVDVDETADAAQHERPTPPSYEPGDSPGAYLRRCREAGGLSIAQVAAETKISSRHLESLENDTFSDLKAEVYVRGFVSTYARALRAAPVEDIVRAFLGAFREQQR